MGCEDGAMSESTGTPPTSHAEPYTAHVALRWSDMDAYAHINNVQFLRLLEDARIIAFRDWVDAQTEGQRSLLDEGVLVARHEIEYRRPLGFRHAPIRIELWVSRIGGAGFDVAYIVRDPDELGDTIYAVAETELALYDFTTSGPRRMRPEERASLLVHAGDPAPFRRRRR